MLELVVVAAAETSSEPEDAVEAGVGCSSPTGLCASAAAASGRLRMGEVASELELLLDEIGVVGGLVRNDREDRLASLVDVLDKFSLLVELSLLAVRWWCLSWNRRSE